MKRIRNLEKYDTKIRITTTYRNYEIPEEKKTYREKDTNKQVAETTIKTKYYQGVKWYCDFGKMSKDDAQAKAQELLLKKYELPDDFFAASRNASDEEKADYAYGISRDKLIEYFSKNTDSFDIKYFLDPKNAKNTDTKKITMSFSELKMLLYFLKKDGIKAYNIQKPGKRKK